MRCEWRSILKVENMRCCSNASIRKVNFLFILSLKLLVSELPKVKKKEYLHLLIYNLQMKFGKYIMLSHKLLQNAHAINIINPISKLRELRFREATYA